MVTAPVVAGVAEGDEASRLVAAAAEQGVSVVARHPVGGGRWLLELTPGPAPGTLFTPGATGVVSGEKTEGVGNLVTGSATGGALDAQNANVARVVAGLRERGFAVLAGPPTPAYALVWARRNAPSWFAPGACVCFPWSPFDRSTADLVVEIDPGAGFGAGGHPTTLGLLAGLVDPALVGPPSGPSGGVERSDGSNGSDEPTRFADLRGRRVLDVGCGTGVLAIAAARCGAGPVDALDIARAALAATGTNAARNGVADRVRLIDADLATCPGPYDVVLANIHADVLIDLAPHLRRLVTQPGNGGHGGDGGAGGLLGVSGVSVAQLSHLEVALAPLRPVRHHRIDDWISLWLRW